MERNDLPAVTRVSKTVDEDDGGGVLGSGLVDDRGQLLKSGCHCLVGM
jgi:hypothetical protein